MFTARATTRWLAAALALSGTTLVPIRAHAQQFEGMIRVRTVMLHSEQVDQLLEERAGGADDTPEDQSEQQYWRGVAAKLLAVPMNELLQFARDNEADVSDVTLYVQGSRIRQEVTQAGGPGMVGLLDLDARTFFFLNMKERYYVDMGQLAETVRDARGQGASAGPGRGRPAARDRGETATVAGMACRVFEVTTEEATTVGCVAGGQQSLEGAVRAFLTRVKSALSPDDEHEVSDEDVLWEQGLPVRTQRFAYQSGYDVDEIIAVERKAVAADLFVVPSGFTKKTIEEMARTQR